MSPTTGFNRDVQRLEIKTLTHIENNRLIVWLSLKNLSCVVSFCLKCLHGISVTEIRAAFIQRTHRNGNKSFPCERQDLRNMLPSKRIGHKMSKCILIRLQFSVYWILSSVYLSECGHRPATSWSAVNTLTTLWYLSLLWRHKWERKFLCMCVCVCAHEWECTETRERKHGGGYGVRSEAGEGDGVRCFRLVESWGGGVNEFAARGTWAPPAALTEPCKQVEWSRNPERRGSLRCDVRGSDRVLCDSETQHTSRLSWAGLLPALPLTLKKGFLCQRTSCTCGLKWVEVEPTPNRGATKCNARSGSPSCDLALASFLHLFWSSCSFLFFSTNTISICNRRQEVSH